jgi:hypothetical protein
MCLTVQHGIHRKSPKSLGFGKMGVCLWGEWEENHDWQSIMSSFAVKLPNNVFICASV